MSILLNGEIIDSSVKAIQSTNEKFIIYTIKLTYQNDLISINNKSIRLDWTVDKRYSDFEELHNNILWQKKSDHDTLPLNQLEPFPPKIFFANSLDLNNNYIKDRKVKLQLYLDSLLRVCVSISNSHVLNFIGLLKILPDKSTQINPIKLFYPSIKRPSLHISLISQELDTGDLVLFKCQNKMSKLQRNITGAEWDHVGVIVNLTLNSYRAFIHNKNKKPKSGPKTKLQVLHRSYYEDGIQPEQTILCIVECTGEGVTCHPLHSRMKAYDFYQICEYIAVRRLNIEDHISRQTPNLPKVGLLSLRRLSFFLTYVIGKPYQLRLRNLVYNLLTTTSTTATCTSVNQRNSNGLLCNMSALTNSNQKFIDNEEYKLKIKEFTKLFSCVASNSRQAFTLDNGEMVQSNDFKDSEESEKKKRTISEDITNTSSNATININVASDKIDKNDVKNTYFCSELVAAFLKTLGVIKSDCPKEENFWPGSFAVNALIDKHIVDPMFYGGTIIIDPEVNSIGYHNVKSSNRISNSSSSKSIDEISDQLSSSFDSDITDSIDIDYTNIKSIDTFVPSL
uniref:PX domain-containing protein n=1 Tax=Chromulina nebulosa TaxID=96789 RepID=A0A7S0XGP2_9STRA|mmetsp:Transcript_3901/g.3501  ORF Transcript_3901/g.3501 Transcript_3901/m.3501 type:complete len:566 (+) Transcript_3901:49-1746(+)